MSNSFRVKLTPIIVDDAVLREQVDAKVLAEAFDELRVLRDTQPDVGKHPLDAFALANRTLAEYRVLRKNSDLGKLLVAAREIRCHIDRAVAITSGAAFRVSRMLFEACCHPYHNELSRGERGSKPRLYFDGDLLDTDHTQGLLDLLTHHPPANIEGQWGLIVADRGQKPSAAVARSIYLTALGASATTSETLAERLLVVTSADDPLRQLAPKLQIEPTFGMPAETSNCTSLFTAQALLPASVVGLDIVKLLEGAAMMHDHFQITAGKENQVFRLAAWLRMQNGNPDSPANLTIFADCRATRVVARWHHEEAFSSHSVSTLPIRLTLDQVRRDPLPASSESPTALSTADPTIEIRLPRLDEGSLGQFCQLIMLATALSKL